MFILNAGLSHKLKNWLMSWSTEIERTKRWANLEKRWLVQSKLEHCLVIGWYLELQILDLGLFYMDGKIRHRPTTFIWSPRFKKAVFKSKLQQQQRSPNLSCSQTLFSVQPISRVLEVQMISNLYPGKMRQFSKTFMI